MTQAPRPLITGLTLLLAAIFLWLGVRELLDHQARQALIKYPSDSIALTYPEASAFTDFLAAHTEQTISIDAHLRFDLAITDNHIIAEACGYATFLDDLIESPRKLNNLPIRVVRLIDPAAAVSQGNLDCTSSIQFTNLTAQELAFEYGGTGTMSIPITGIFKIERDTSPQSKSSPHYRLIKQSDGIF